MALAGLGEGEEPSEEVLRGCEEFLCSLFCPCGVHIGEAKMLRYFCSSYSEMNKELTNCYQPREHGLNIIIRHAHVQANMTPGYGIKPHLS